MNGVDYFNQGVYSSSGEESSGLLSDFIDDGEIEEEWKPKPKRLKCIRSASKRTISKTNQQKKTIPSFHKNDGLIQLGKSECKIVGRDHEVQQILAMVLQPSPGMHPLLLGPRGVGKLSIIEKLAHHERLKDRHIYLLDCSNMIAENLNQDLMFTIKNKLTKIRKVVERSLEPKPIIYFRHIEKFMEMEYIPEFMKSLFSDPFPIIGSISQTGAEDLTSVISTLTSFNFCPITVEESPLHEIQEIVYERIKSNPTICYTDEALTLAVRLAAKYFTLQPLPIKAINVVQECAMWHSLSASNASSSLSDHRITPFDVSQFVSLKIGIPPEDLMNDTLFNKQRFAQSLNRQIIGQEYAINVISELVASFKRGFTLSDKAWGRFLFVGPSGVGKTELAKQLAKSLFQNNKNFLFFAGGDYNESFTASNLLGSPKGYEDHNTGGLLTGPLIENPHQVVLFDEFEKAHDEVRKLFLQALGQGWLTDGRGIIADCTKAVFIMTSNVGASILFNQGKRGIFAPEKALESIKPLLIDEFSTELCRRFSNIIPFQPIKKSHFPQLALLTLETHKKHLLLTAQIELEWNDKVIAYLTKLPCDLQFGASEFRECVQQEVVEALNQASELHNQVLTGKVFLTVNAGGLTCVLTGSAG